MKVVLSSRGSRGDVAPIIAIGAGLHERGHDTVLCVPKLFADSVASQGMRVVPYSEDSERMMTEFGSDWRGLQDALKWFSRSIDEQFDWLLEQTADADVLVASTNEIAAPSVAEFRGIPFVRVTFAPMMTGYRFNPLLPWQGLPRWANRAGWALINLTVDALSYRAINARRQALRLPRVMRVGDYVARYGHTLFAMSSALAPPCPSWQGRYRHSYTGYCHDLPVGELTDELSQFLSSGSPPIYVGFGSVTMTDPDQLARNFREAIERIGCRAVLGAGWTGFGGRGSSSNVLVIGDTSHAALFPATAGVIHHGGSGTTHTAARAGVPQLVLPQFADQHFWGHRVHRLGLGPAPLSPKTRSVDQLTRALTALLTKRRYTHAVQQLAETLGRESGTAGAVATIESLAGQPRAL